MAMHRLHFLPLLVHHLLALLGRGGAHHLVVQGLHLLHVFVHLAHLTAHIHRTSRIAWRSALGFDAGAFVFCAKGMPAASRTAVPTAIAKVFFM